MNRRHFLTTSAGLFGSAYLVGCGGGSSSFGGGRGRAAVTIKWPPRTRLIPVMANSIVVQILDGLTVVDTVTLTRNGGSLTTTATFTDLPAKSLDLFFQAFPNADGTGVAQGVAIQNITIVAGQTASVTTTMFSTVDHIDITSAGSATTLGVGATLQLTATAKDADNFTVITPALAWSSSDTAKATVSGAGLVTGVAGGSVAITAEDTESHITGTFNLTVQGPASIFFNHGGNIKSMADMSGSGLAAGSQSLASAYGLFRMANGTLIMTGSNRVWQASSISGPWTSLGNVTLGNGVNQFNAPFRPFVDGTGKIYIPDYNNHRIVRINDITGAGWTTYGSSGSGTGRFINPAHTFVDSAGKIYIADFGNRRIVRMDNITGAGWTSYGSNGSGVGNFSGPNSAVVGSDGKIYIADSTNNRIVRMNDMTGAGWTTYGSSGNGIGQFSYPVKCVMGSDGKLYIADRTNSRIVRMDDMTGAGWTTYNAGSGLVWDVAVV